MGVTHKDNLIVFLSKCPVRIDWKDLRRYIKVDIDKNQLILGGDPVIDVLVDTAIEGTRNAQPANLKRLNGLP
jgi:hypothetical protein